jgi:hypothetical protein
VSRYLNVDWNVITCMLVLVNYFESSMLAAVHFYNLHSTQSASHMRILVKTCKTPVTSRTTKRDHFL